MQGQGSDSFVCHPIPRGGERGGAEDPKGAQLPAELLPPLVPLLSWGGSEEAGPVLYHTWLI